MKLLSVKQLQARFKVPDSCRYLIVFKKAFNDESIPVSREGLRKYLHALEVEFGINYKRSARSLAWALQVQGLIDMPKYAAICREFESKNVESKLLEILKRI